MNHFIKHQHLHVEVIGTEADGLTLSGSLSGLCNDWLFPALERVLDRCALAHRHLYIEYLEIDAGLLSVERLEHDLPEVVAQVLEIAIKEKMESSQARISSANSLTEREQYKTERQVVFEAFLYFLETGRLPWSYRLPENTTLETVLIAFWRDGQKSQNQSDTGGGYISGQSAYFTYLYRLLTGSLAARQRLSWQFSSSFLNILLEQVSLNRKKAVELIISKLRETAIPPADKILFEEKLWQAAFLNLQSQEVSMVPGLIAATLHALASAMPQPAFNEILKTVEIMWPEVKPGKIFLFDKKEELGPGSSTAEDPLSQTTRSLPGTIQTDNVQNKQDLHGGLTSEDNEGIYVDNAGLVLLHPFLSRFFEGLGVSSEDKLLHPFRALCLLHFLVFDKTIAPEYDLALPKVLCNLPVDTPVKSDVTLTEDEKKEANALLEAIIRHWEALRSTSPDALRGTFLARSGKLSLREDGDWFLQVESQSYDILLNQLPWGISMIKLPWMEQMLWVEWR